MEGIVFFIVIGLVIILLFAVSRKVEGQRTEQFQSVAAELGMEFYPEGDLALQDSIGHLPLFNRGRRRKFMNVLRGRNEGIDMAIFGYRFVTGSGKNQSTHTQSVFCFRSGRLDLPEFELRPEHIFHKIGKVFGYQDIGFQSHPEFSKRYLLRGADESRIRQCFTSEILSYLETQSGISVEANGHCLICYRARRRIKPEDVRTFMDEGLAIYKLFIKD